MPRNICKEVELTVSGTDADKWRYMYGTDSVGNLPEFKKLRHVGNCYAPCPYSETCDELRVRIMLGLGDSDPLPTQVLHTGLDGKNYFMKTTCRGGIWGQECTFPGCSYYLSNGVKYFYV